MSREIQTGDLERLGRLPGTRAEGERIASMIGVKPLLGEEALEARIKACRSPRILHLATHGFFLADRQRDPNRELRGLGLLGGQAGDGFGQMPERMSGPGMENPLLRSGVLLAGFKTWLKGGSLPAEAEDGLLTSSLPEGDVSGLDLLATELVVLSACETGPGRSAHGRGRVRLAARVRAGGGRRLW